MMPFTKTFGSLICAQDLPIWLRVLHLMWDERILFLIGIVVLEVEVRYDYSIGWRMMQKRAAEAGVNFLRWHLNALRWLLNVQMRSKYMFSMGK